MGWLSIGTRNIDHFFLSAYSKGLGIGNPREVELFLLYYGRTIVEETSLDRDGNVFGPPCSILNIVIIGGVWPLLVVFPLLRTHPGRFTALAWGSEGRLG